MPELSADKEAWCGFHADVMSLKFPEGFDKWEEVNCPRND